MLKFNLFKYKEHPLTYSSKNLNNLPEDIISLLNKWDVEFSDRVIIVEENNNLVGFFRYDLGNIKPWLYAAGTYVIPKYRKQDIGFNLWNKAIMMESPKQIFAHVASVGGLKIIERIKKEFPIIKYNLTMDNNYEI